MKKPLLVLLASGLVLLIAASSASAAFGLKAFEVSFTDESGHPVVQAGAHPFEMSTDLEFEATEDAEGAVSLEEAAKDIELVQPEGFAGNPTAVPRCSAIDFLTATKIPSLSGGELIVPNCPNSAAVGTVSATLANVEGKLGTLHAAVYDLEPPPGKAAKLGFWVSGVPITIELGIVGEFPYQIIGGPTNVSQVLEVVATQFVLWGDPGSPAHDALRGKCLDVSGVSQGTCPAGIPEKPFLTMPRSCDAPVTILAEADSWQRPGIFTEPVASIGPAMSGCSTLGFAPEIDNQPTSHAGESPTGLDFDLNVNDPGLTEAAGTAGSDIETATVTLPQGVTTNPAVASGLQACTLAAYQAAVLGHQTCPEASKIGEVEVETPLLETEDGGLEILHGHIYVAKQHDNPFDNLLTVYMIIEDPKLGIFIKQAGKVEPDPATGQLTTTFDHLPPLPFSHFHLHFRDGERAPLITPSTCGDFSTEAELHSYARPETPLHKAATFTIESGADGGPCVTSPAQLPNAPSFSAGTLGPKAGSYSPFVLRLTRSDGSQQFSAVVATLPKGLIGRLAGIPYCPDAAIAQAATRSGEGQGAQELANPSCPAASEVGTVTAGAGAGTEPLYVQGHAYLAGPYKGAPLSLEIITPAIAGPFDLGVIAVRTALQVDPFTAEVSALSDPIPTILHGLPLDVRSIAINMDRPNFTLNPTSCEPKTISGSLTSTLGATAHLSQYFQASECAALKFKPNLKISLKGSTKHAGHPALKAVLTYPKGVGYANVGRVQVNLPHSEFIDQSNLNKTCTKPVLLAGACPKTSIYGKAKAWTPLLDKPLEGNVYLVGGFGYKLPALVAELNGQIRVLLAGKVDSGPNKGIRNTFEAVPDAPVEKFVLELKGGPKYSLLENSEPLCQKPQRAIERFTAQNGKVLQTKPLIANECGKKATGKKPKRRKHGKRGAHSKAQKSKK